MNYYNEIDPAAAAWLRELISAGLIAPGDVDERSIEYVRPADVVGYRQCHFFAGIGGWSYALRLAGILDDYPVWTASCPCQPFSAAGKGGGFDDDRHLWPSFYWLASQCRPAIIFGEQVASKATEPWFDLVQTDLEALDYAFGIIPFPAASVGAPHIRDRAYWVGYSSCARGEAWLPEQAQRQTRDAGVLNDRGGECAGPGQRPEVIGLENPNPTGPTNGHWGAADWLYCRDGKWRPVEPGTFPLVDGLPRGVVPECDPGEPGYAEKTAEARIMRLRGYGNAIVPQQAAEFIMATMEVIQ